MKWIFRIYVACAIVFSCILAYYSYVAGVERKAAVAEVVAAYQQGLITDVQAVNLIDYASYNVMYPKKRYDNSIEVRAYIARLNSMHQ